MNKKLKFIKRCIKCGNYVGKKEHICKEFGPNKGRIFNKIWKKRISLSNKGKLKPKLSEVRKKLFKEGNLGTRMGIVNKNKYQYIICPCGNEFQNYKSVNRKYCSQKCYLNRENIKKCLKCGSFIGKDHDCLKINKRLGKKHSQETINKIKEARAKQIIPFKDTLPEILMQNKLNELNINFTTHKPILGQPDIFIEPNICIFVDGCYWHGCEKCYNKNEFKEWQRGQIIRDIMVTQKLIEQNYIVLRLWEHEIKENIEECVDKILFLIKKLEEVK